LVASKTARVGGELDSGIVSLLESLFDSASRLRGRGRSDASEDLHAEPIVGYEWARLGIGTDSIVLLLPAADSEPRQDLEYIKIEPNAHY
jgi:hypothetical protein